MHCYSFELLHSCSLHYCTIPFLLAYSCTIPSFTIIFSVSSLLNKRQNHPIEKVKEANQVKGQLNETFPLMLGEASKDFGRVKPVSGLLDAVGVVEGQGEVEEEGEPVEVEEH